MAADSEGVDQGLPPANGTMDVIAKEAGNLSIEIVDVAGNVDDVAGRITSQAEEFHRLNEAAEQVAGSNAAIVEAAVASFLSPDGADKREAAFARRLDRLSRQVQRLERDLGVTAETLALFVRFWLTITPPLPNDAQASAQAKGRERFEGFIETLGRRLQKGQSFLKEIPDDIGGNNASDDDGQGDERNPTLSMNQN